MTKKIEDLLKITQHFYTDHVERDLEAPPVIHETKSHYWIDPNHPDMGELLSDANFYHSEWEEGGFIREPYIQMLAKSAHALIKAHEKWLKA